MSVLVLVSLWVVSGCHAQGWDGTLVQFGKMHEAIGQQQHHGRVQLSDVVRQPHFFGVGALAKLAGEITIHDGQVIVTGVDESGQLQAAADDATALEATILVGAHVDEWVEHKVSANVSADEFDEYIAAAASGVGVETSQPFVFTVEGELRNLRLHVINGACPLHAKRNQQDLPQSKQPYERAFEKIDAALVGVFAKDAVGKLTHPGTTTHTHVLFEDHVSGKMMTGHVEEVSLAAGAMLRLPKVTSNP